MAVVAPSSSEADYNKQSYYRTIEEDEVSFSSA
jgi:hypothetical protein